MLVLIWLFKKPIDSFLNALKMFSIVPSTYVFKFDFLFRSILRVSKLMQKIANLFISTLQ